MTYQKHCPSCFTLKDAVAVCPQCGFDESTARSALFLPYGTVLAGQYRVGRVLGKPGSFGITYQGWDINLQQRVAIKEFLPPDIAERVPRSADVAVMEPEERQRFENGKAAFLREARIVAQLDHPNVVRVRTFFNANGTAYLVMDYYDGMTMATYLAEKQPSLAPELAIPVMLPILDGLRYLHARGLIHRDIKPNNIYLATIGRAILLDFGAARQATAEGDARSMSVALSGGYAPLEQYQRRSSQGPWTDVYGAAATLYRMITGHLPPGTLDRLADDPRPLARRAAALEGHSAQGTGIEARRSLPHRRGLHAGAGAVHRRRPGRARARARGAPAQSAPGPGPGPTLAAAANRRPRTRADPGCPTRATRPRAVARLATHRRTGAAGRGGRLDHRLLSVADVSAAARSLQPGDRPAGAEPAGRHGPGSSLATHRMRQKPPDTLRRPSCLTQRKPSRTAVAT
mgnify:CR=1 FL=1